MNEVAIREDGWSLALELSRNGALRSTGLFLSYPNLSYEQFEAIGFMLGRLHQSLRFAIGDWLLLGEALFPTLVYQAAEALGISEEGMKEYVRVSQAVPRSTRRRALSWSHHRAVTALEPPKQKEWLRRAEEEHLSHHALRDALRAESSGVDSPDPPPGPARCSCCGARL